MRTSLFVFVLVACSGCAYPVSLQSDHGRAYTQAFSKQSDLERPSVAKAAIRLDGVEAIQLRMRVEEASTDRETGEAETTRSVD